MLIDETVPTGAVGTIAGVPESYKSWLAQQISVSVAAGHGRVLGRRVTRQGPVGYFWQDDSTREELERIKLYQRFHKTPEALPLTWYLNVSLQLPRDIESLKETVLQNGLVLVTLDSFYNVLLGQKLKEDVPEQVVALLKQEIADATGCTVLIVDHMPWSTDGHARAYGGVFKAAATRFGIYLEAKSQTVKVEVRGNNIKSYKTKARWNSETLELEIYEKSKEDEVIRRKRIRKDIVAVLTKHGDHSTNQLVSFVTGNDTEIKDVATGMASDPTSPVRQYIGPRRATMWSVSKESQ